MEDFIAISMLSQYYYCKRRASLLLIERKFTDNQYTIEGNLEHNKIHQSNIEKRKNFIKISNIQIYSKKLQLLGYTDCIEFTKMENGTYIKFLNDYFDIFPVEYKHGKKRDELEYNVQLCAQAMCLEEMYNCSIKSGAIYYIDSNSRINVEFDNNLRNLVQEGIIHIQDIIKNQKILKEKYSKKCDKCSLFDICNPKLNNTKKYTQNLWKEVGYDETDRKDIIYNNR